MISWYKVNNNCWIFTYKSVPIEVECFKDVIICSLEAGLNWKEMKIACEEMDTKQKNYYEFRKGN